MKLRISLLFSFVLMALGLSAQSLVFHLSSGAKSIVSLPATFTVTPSGDKLVIDSEGTRVELGDGDVTCVTYRAKSGDVNGDQIVDVADIATVLRLMAGYKLGEDDNPINTGQAPENAKAIDLGLPSGTLWANMNVGATSTQENGLYFAWGETKGYTADTSDGRSFDWASYKWMTPGQSDWKYINKYQVADDSISACWYRYNWDILEYEFIGDGKSVLDPEDDAAVVNWGGDWRMPTWDEIKELCENTTNEWITVGNVCGRKFTGKNGNSIFLPSAGLREKASLIEEGKGYYWSSSIVSLDLSGDIETGSAFYIVSRPQYDAYIHNFKRCNGRTVRPVLKK